MTINQCSRRECNNESLIVDGYCSFACRDYDILKEEHRALIERGDGISEAIDEMAIYIVDLKAEIKELEEKLERTEHYKESIVRERETQDRLYLEAVTEADRLHKELFALLEAVDDEKV